MWMMVMVVMMRERMVGRNMVVIIYSFASFDTLMLHSRVNREASARAIFRQPDDVLPNSGR